MNTGVTSDDKNTPRRWGEAMVVARGQQLLDKISSDSVCRPSKGITHNSAPILRKSIKESVMKSRPVLVPMAVRAMDQAGPVKCAGE